MATKPPSKFCLTNLVNTTLKRVPKKLESIVSSSISGVAHQLTGEKEKGKKITANLPKEPAKTAEKSPGLSKNETAQLPALKVYVDRKLQEVEQKYKKPIELSKEINTNKNRISTIKTEMKDLLIGKDGSNNFARITESVSSYHLNSDNNFLSEATYKKSSSQTSEILKLNEELQTLLTGLETSKKEGMEKIQNALNEAEPNLQKLKHTVEKNILDYSHSLDLEESSKMEEIESLKLQALESFTIFGKIIDFIIGLINSEWLQSKKEETKQGKEIIEDAKAKVLKLKQELNALRETSLERINKYFATDFENALKPIEEIRQDSENNLKKLDEAIQKKRFDIANAKEIDDREQEKMGSISKKFSDLITLMKSIEDDRKNLNINGKLAKAARLAREGKIAEVQHQLLKQDLDSVKSVNADLLEKIEQFLSAIEEVNNEIGEDEFMNKTFGDYIKECELYTNRLKTVRSTIEGYTPLIEKFIILANELDQLEKSTAPKIVEFNKIAVANDLQETPQKGSEDTNHDEIARNDAIYRGYSPLVDYDKESAQWNNYRKIVDYVEKNPGDSAKYVKSIQDLIKEME